MDNGISPCFIASLRGRILQAITKSILIFHFLFFILILLQPSGSIFLKVSVLETHLDGLCPAFLVLSMTASSAVWSEAQRTGRDCSTASETGMWSFSIHSTTSEEGKRKVTELHVNMECQCNTYVLALFPGLHTKAGRERLGTRLCVQGCCTQEKQRGRETRSIPSSSSRAFTPEGGVPSLWDCDELDLFRNLRRYLLVCRGLFCVFCGVSFVSSTLCF